MSNNKNFFDDSVLDSAIDAICADTPDDREVEAATAQVWAALAAESSTQEAARPTVAGAHAEASEPPLRSCEDFRALLPALVAGTLSEGRRLLVEDHTRTCIPCRRALQAIRAGRAVERPAEETAHRRAVDLERPSPWRWALAAAAVVAAVLGGWAVWRGPWLLPQDDLMQVRSLEGRVFALDGDELQPVHPGDSIDGNRLLRTAGSSTAIAQLADGSRVEIAPRSQFRVQRQRHGLQLRVDRGSVIVEASDQGSGTLGVSTDELLVSVKGTIFAVTHGSKGSRVSVVEGEVAVEQGRKRRNLYPGQQITSRPTVVPASFKEELGWSSNVDRYLTMLEEMRSLQHDLNEVLASSGLRTSSTLLDKVPSSTVVYAAVPNPTATLSNVYQLIRERLDSNPLLAEWWSQAELEDWIAPFDHFVASMQQMSEYLGEETVIALGLDANGEPGIPVVLSEVSDADALRSALAAQLAEISAAVGEELPVVLLSPTATTVPAGDHLYVWIGPNLLIASTNIAEINQIANGQTAGFAATPFGAEIDRAYQQGTQYLGAVDLVRVFRAARQELQHGGDQEADRALELSGFDDARYLVVDRHHEGERAHTAAELSFSGQRHGLAAWLAPPGPMGALDFISPDATLVSAFLIQDPVTMLDQVFGLAGEESDEFQQAIADIESELGLSLRDDLVAPFGGEVAFAIDGPALPTPSWKLIVEVYDEATLQATFEKLAQRAQDEVRNEGVDADVGLEEEVADGRTYYRLTLHAEDLPVDTIAINYTYVDGYLLAAPNRAMIDRAIQQRDSGSSLLTADKFRSLLPTDGYIDFSALVYNRIGEAISQFADKVPLPDQLTEEQRSRFDALVGEIASQTGPSLYALYGEDDRIRLSSNSPGLIPFGSLGAVFGLGSVLQEMGGLEQLQEQLQVRPPESGTQPSRPQQNI